MLGLGHSGSSYGTVTRAIASLALDTSHFTGRSWERIGDPAPGHKICGKCLREKPLSEFYRRGKGHQSRCKRCHDDALYDHCACGRRKAARYQRCRSCRDEDRPPPRTDMSDAEVAWIAGVLEGEGCWTRCGTHGGWRVAVRMTDEDVIRRLQVITGIGTITVESSKKGYKTAWCWCVAARVHREWLTVQVWPWMGERRRSRILELWPEVQAVLTQWQSSSPPNWPSGFDPPVRLDRNVAQ